MPIKAVLFDMFDTLMLIEKDHEFYRPSLKRTYESLVASGVNAKFEDFEKAYVKARDAIFAEAEANLEEPHFNVRISNALKLLGYDFGVSSRVVSEATNAFCEGFMKYVRIDKNAKNVLQKLHGKYKLGIVSNFALPECVLTLLEKHGLRSFFDVVVVSGAVNKRKPSPEIFRKALEELDAAAAEAVFVGDTVDADIEGAKSAGMKTIFLERRVQKEAENACPDQTVKTLGDLLSALERC